MIVFGVGGGIGLGVVYVFVEVGVNVVIWYNSNKDVIKKVEDIE